MSYENRKLGLDTLSLDLKNPRFPSVDSEQEAIDQILERIPDKIVALARDIVKNGLNPTAVPAIFAVDDGTNIVKDGNRRITALKLIKNPKLVKDPELRKKFQKLAAKNTHKFSYIDCIVFDNEEEADIWVQTNHNDKGNGVGQEKWGALMKLRDLRNHNKVVPLLDLYERATSDISLNEDNFSISTFQRVVMSKHFKERTGWKLDNNQLTVDLSENDFKKVLKEIALDVYDPERDDAITTRDVNSSKDIENYLVKKDKKGLFEKSAPSILSLISPSPVPKHGRIRKGPNKKNSLIPEETEWDIPNPRIRDVYDELKSISVERHPNAVSILLRAFVELSIKKYMTDNNLQVGTLAENISTVANDLQSKGRITKNQQIAIKGAVNRSENTIDLATELNQYGHNYDINPTPVWVINDFNTLKSLFDGIYGKELAEQKQQ